ncbi:energy transducer TonB [Salinisphaera aquimarina]|uniref:Energy transducer TonB n=1 Tax=Salinisphaera aquimarina TaxID=2094031 RepID=A0ABV7EU12_9GAMM
MSDNRIRFIICVALALAAHAVLLGWTTDTGRASSQSLLEVTRNADDAATPRSRDILAVQDQRGDDSYSQQQRSGDSSPMSAQSAQAGRTPTVTRFVMVARRPQTPEGTNRERITATDAGANQIPRDGKTMDASGDPRAAYLADWQQQIEARGSRQYPSTLLADGQPRRLTMAVRLNADGSLQAVRVVHSSGSHALDRAAESIVRDAAPFTPFDTRLGDSAGALSFVYDWLFEPGADTRLRPSG